MLFRSTVDVVYFRVGEEVVVICFFHESFFLPKIEAPELLMRHNEIEALRESLEEFAQKTGCELREDPHNEDDALVVFHMFRH